MHDGVNTRCYPGPGAFVLLLTVGCPPPRHLLLPHPPPIEPVLTRLINDLSAISDDFVPVLDDNHVIITESIHRGLTFLLGHLPTQMHLMVATRTDPPLPLTLLRGRG